MLLDIWFGFLAGLGYVLFSVAVIVAVIVIMLVIEWIGEEIQWARQRRQDRIEKELNQREIQLRATILDLAEAIAEDRIHAAGSSRELIRHGFLESDKIGPRQ